MADRRREDGTDGRKRWGECTTRGIGGRWRGWLRRDDKAKSTFGIKVMGEEGRCEREEAPREAPRGGSGDCWLMNGADLLTRPAPVDFGGEVFRMSEIYVDRQT